MSDHPRRVSEPPVPFGEQRREESSANAIEATSHERTTTKREAFSTEEGLQIAIRTLETLLKDPLYPRPLVVFVNGPAGVGKTHFSTELVERLGKQHHQSIFIETDLYGEEAIFTNEDFQRQVSAWNTHQPFTYHNTQTHRQEQAREPEVIVIGGINASRQDTGIKNAALKIALTRPLLESLAHKCSRDYIIHEPTPHPETFLEEICTPAATHADDLLQHLLSQAEHQCEALAESDLLVHNQNTPEGWPRLTLRGEVLTFTANHHGEKYALKRRLAPGRARLLKNIQELEQPRSETMAPILPLPLEIADRFLKGDLLAHATIVREGHRSTIYRCFERFETVPGVDNAVLRLDYRRYTESPNQLPDALHFEYLTTDAMDPDKRMLVAEMHLTVQGLATFYLDHRLVHPHFRKRKGIGTRLLLQAESWLEQLAQVHGQDIRLSLTAGQQPVIAWALKMGFTVQEDRKQELEEVLHHPDHFEVQDIGGDDGVKRPGYLFRRGVLGRTYKDAIRLTFVKIISPTSSHQTPSEDL